MTPALLSKSDDRTATLVARLTSLEAVSQVVFQDAAAIAAAICHTQYALVCAVAGDHVEIKAEVGRGSAATGSRGAAGFCVGAMKDACEVFIEDLEADPAWSSFVTSTGFDVRAFFGVELVVDGQRVGLLCAFDRESRSWCEAQASAFQAAARQLSERLALGLRAQEFEDREKSLQEALDRSEHMTDLLAFSAKRFESLFNGLPIACCTLDTDGQVMEWNKNSENVFGFSASEVLFQDVFEILRAPDPFAARDQILGPITVETITEDFEQQVTHKDGSEIWILSSSLPFHNPQGDTVGVIWSSIDITDRKAAEAKLIETNRVIEEQRGALETVNGQLEKLACTDALTGLYNRRACFDYLNQHFSKHKSLSNPEGTKEMAVILLDVDKFKSLNDEFGHPEGDAVLKQVASVLQASARDGDFVARYGGEEFIVLLLGTGVNLAAEVAERMREAVEVAPWTKRPVTASFGVASSSGTETLEELVRFADEALYDAKHGGRNQVALFTQVLTAA
jgi:diguanylate cyclase (GGDEF)-like protein/PAS domain S-box-containing protein